MGFRLIRFTTEFDTVKLGFNDVTEKLRLPSALSRVASSISPSDGEPFRVGTFAVAPFVGLTRLRSESNGKT